MDSQTAHTFSQVDESECTQEATPLTQSQNGFKSKPNKIRFKLISLSGKGKHFDITEDMKEIVIGRSIDCTIQISQKHISKLHCRIYLKDQGLYMIEDLSTNGTYINKRLIGNNNSHVLQHSDEISLSSNKVASYAFMDLSFKSNFDSTIFGEEISNMYLIQEEIGCGNSSIVRKAINKFTGEMCAIKIIKKNIFSTQLKTKEQVQREVKVLKRVSHPNIIKYENIVNSEDYLYIVLELATGGDLFDRIGKMNEKESKTVFVQILNAVEYLHSLGIAHRDLKPENILLDSNNKVKLTDFGLAKMTDSNNMVTLCGTPSYLAPEIIKLGSKETKKGYSIAVDMWSLGVILYLMLSGTPPFYDDVTRRMSLYEQIETGDYEFDNINWKNISPDAMNLIKKLLVLDPDHRLTAKDALNHPWVNENMKNDCHSEITSSIDNSCNISEVKKVKRKFNDISPFEDAYKNYSQKGLYESKIQKTGEMYNMNHSNEQVQKI